MNQVGAEAASVEVASIASSLTALDTRELVVAAQGGEPMAYEELVRRYQRYVWSVVRSFRMNDEDSRDAVQMTWLRLVENLHGLRDPGRLGGWLATTASRECLRAIRRRDRELPDRDDSLLDRVDERAPGPEDRVVRESMAELLWARVSELPPRGQTLLRALTGQQGLGYAELSRLTGMPIGSIGPTRARQLARLRRALEDCGLGAEAWA